jgi:regulator of protease activity HflC (stomatin/prohibitin superfamily)
MRSQDCISKDNVTLHVDVVVFYKVVDPMKFVCAVEEYDSAINKLCRVYVREVISTASVNQISHNRRAFSAHVLENVQTYACEWGIEIIRVRLDHIKFDQTMARALARREKQATLIHTEVQ